MSSNPRSPDFGWNEAAARSLAEADIMRIFRQTCFNRFFEFEVAKAVKSKRIKAPIYLSVGQEHIPATIAAIAGSPKIFAQHRAHSYYLSFGGNPGRLVDELIHKDSGCAGGMGGSASLHSPEIGMFGHSGLMGDQVPIAVGYALVSGQTTLTVVGDASAEEDYVFGALGFAATKKVPLLVVCEDNDLSILTRTSTRRSWKLTDVAQGYGFGVADIADDPWLMAYHLRQAMGRLPFFLNVRTCRQLWHAGTGNDGEPEWNRFELFKSKLGRMGKTRQVAEIEAACQKEVCDLWV